MSPRAVKPFSPGLERFPRHVAIIADGNGRWAQKRHLPHAEGHRQGLEVLRNIVRHASQIGLSYLTFYAFSSENWSRSREEIETLMGLARLFVRRDLAALHAAGVRVKVIGGRDALSPDLLRAIIEAETLTADNPGLTLVIAFNYGGRQEIVRTVQALVRDAAEGRLAPDQVDEALFAARLDTKDIPDPDLIIRTSGEERLSNFLLWQAAYAELLFLPLYWPEFTTADLDAAIAIYATRDRRFGGRKALA